MSHEVSHIDPAMNPVAGHELSLQPDLEAALSHAAETRGITLEADRLTQLTAQAQGIQLMEQREESRKPEKVFNDTSTGVSVTRATFSEDFNATVGEVDFTPIFEEEEDDWVIGDAAASPEHASETSLRGIRGLQNYVLLADAGVIQRPEILYGNTNPEMAIAAERFGMLSDIARQDAGNPKQTHEQMRQMEKLKISANFDEVGQRVFSADVQRLERILTRRLAVQQPAGAVALHKSVA